MTRSGGGSIINMSSVSAQGITGQSAYSAAKAGLEAVTRVMNKELGPMGVRVNVSLQASLRSQQRMRDCR